MKITKDGITELNDYDRQRLYDGVFHHLQQSYMDKKIFDNAPPDAMNKGEWLPELIEWQENCIFDMWQKWDDIIR